MNTEVSKIILRDLSTIRDVISRSINCSADARAYKGVTDAIEAIQDDLEVKSMLALKSNQERTDQ